MIRREVAIWTPPGRRPSAQTLALADMARELGGAAALSRYTGDRRTAYIHGERHDLWWEFALEHSFRWQGHVNGMAPDLVRQRMRDLCDALRLTPLLRQRGEELQPGERARADLAAALLPKPQVLLWEEPYRLLRGEDRRIADQLLRMLGALEGLTVIAVAAERPGLREDVQHEQQYSGRSGGAGGRAGARRAGGRSVAGGALWA